MGPRIGRRMAVLTAAAAIAAACSGCAQNCVGNGLHCGRGKATAAERAYLRDPRAIRARLRQLERRSGPRVGGLALNMYGDLTVSVTQHGRVGISYQGTAQTGYPSDGDPEWDPISGRNLPLSDVDPAVLSRLIERTQREVPKQYFQDALLSIGDTGRPLWTLEYFPTEFTARADGSGLCESFSPDRCPESMGG